MRTTIDLTDDQRARLLELAARQGEKGFSRLIQEAVDRYLEELERGEEAVQRALGVLGTLSEKSERTMRSSIEALRKRWR
jgi:metal-responsive CopG/Arc/MetJ family transcriptional regulator